MQNHFPLWKNLLVLIIFGIGIIYSLPTLYGEDPSVQVSSTLATKIGQEQANRIESEIKSAGVTVKAFEFKDGRILARFNNTDDQLKVDDLLRDSLGSDYTVALNLAPTTPGWLRALGANAMYLGLDLRGGVHFLLEVDMDAAARQAEDRYTEDVRLALRNAKIRYQSVSKDGGFIKVTLKTADDKPALLTILDKDFRTLDITEPEAQDQVWLKVSEKEVREIKKFAVSQNMTTLRNRVNELGVAEPIIQQQGENRIMVQLPGVQDTTRAKEILGTTATLEYRMVDVEHDVQQAVAGHVPVGSRLFFERNGNPILLDRRVIVTGDLVFIEYKVETKTVNGQKVRHKEKVEKVINVATIQGVFSNRFQTTGLDSPEEARNLSLLLRAGALAAPVEIVEERTVGPSLGQDNINKGMLSFVVGFALVVLFMAVYYRLFGMIADLALAFNVVIVVAILSMLQATLTLPGIAGIILTVGMSVDANVLIFERIKEELKNGHTPQSAIYIGYEKAFATILDSHFTNLVVAVVLFAFGTGSIKGFAVTLIIGILSSMFTAITGTRMVINWIYGNRRVEKLSI
ncbi:MAG: preprotein translocase subunit SecD [Methylococcaceae bacterium NSM2-1]|nr:MAG: preprotein translocase subunit SecD [Methylococcaceae bacterium NSM2-1]